MSSMVAGWEMLEAAARGDIPAQFAPALGVVRSPDERLALVLLGTNGATNPYPYQVVCERTIDGWIGGTSANAPGWSSTARGEAPNVGVISAWGEAPPDAALRSSRSRDASTRRG